MASGGTVNAPLAAFLEALALPAGAPPVEGRFFPGITWPIEAWQWLKLQFAHKAVG